MYVQFSLIITPCDWSRHRETAFIVGCGGGRRFPDIVRKHHWPGEQGLTDLRRVLVNKLIMERQIPPPI
jgi:hypothetical protein